MEDAYLQFCRKSAPIWLWLTLEQPLTFIILGGVIYAMLFIVNPRIASTPFPFANSSFDWFDFALNWGVAVVFAYFIYRGRHTLRTILIGRLNAWQTVVIALIAAGSSIVWEYGLVLRIYGADSVVPLHLPRDDLAIYGIAVAPVKEEFVFQASLQTALERFGPVGAVVATTIVFTIWHIGTRGTFVDPNFLEITRNGMLIGFVPLLTFAIVRQTTKSLAAAILAHMLVNIAAETTLK